MKNQRTLFYLLTANSISGFSQGITMLSVPWYFSKVLDEGALFGKGYTIITILSVIWTLYAGTLVDRYSRKKIFLLLNVAGAIILGSVSLSGYLLGEVPQVLALAAFGGTMFIFNLHYPTLYGLGQEITERRNYSKINSQLEIQNQITSMLAGAMAALLLTGVSGDGLQLAGMHIPIPLHIRPWRLHEVFLLDAATYTISFILISRIQYQPLVERIIDTSPIFRRLQTGFRYLISRPRLFLFGVASLSIFVVLMVHEFYLLSLYVNKQLQQEASVYASCQLFYALGAVMAGLSIRWIFIKVHYPIAIGILLSMASIFTFILSASSSVLITFIFSVVLGLSNAGSRILRITYIFHRVNNDMIGRVNSVFSISHALSRAVFIFIFSLPFFVTGNNIIYSYLIFGIYTFTAACLLFYSSKKMPRIE